MMMFDSDGKALNILPILWKSFQHTQTSIKYVYCLVTHFTNQSYIVWYKHLNLDAWGLMCKHFVPLKGIAESQSGPILFADYIREREIKNLNNESQLW